MRAWRPYFAQLCCAVGGAHQVTTCEQLHAYLNKFVATEAASSAPSAAATVSVPEGFKAMKKKSVEEELDGAGRSVCQGLDWE